MYVLAIALLTLLNGLFAMSELAVVSSRKTRLQIQHEEGKAGAAAALKLLERPTRFLSTVQVGMTSVGIINGIVGDAAFSAPVAELLHSVGVAETLAPLLATALVVVVITFITILFGELVPKRIGQMYPEAVARVMARPMAWLGTLVMPFVALLTLCTQYILKWLRVDESNGDAITEAEIFASMAQSVDAGLMEEQEHRMIRNVFHLDDRPLTSVMLPRDEIEWLDSELTVGAALNQITGHEREIVHSWYPVCRLHLDNVLGIISIARMLRLSDTPDAPLHEHLAPVAFIPETLSGMEMLEQMRAKSGRIMLVVDEYGSVQGLMTPRDLLEAITGELQPDIHTDAWAVPLTASQWILEGAIPVSELKAQLKIKKLPFEDTNRYNTLAGLLMFVSGRVLSDGDHVQCAGWNFQIKQAEGYRIDKVIAKKI